MSEKWEIIDKNSHKRGGNDKVICFGVLKK